MRFNDEIDEYEIDEYVPPSIRAASGRTGKTALVLAVGLCEKLPYFQQVLARHGIDISPRLVQEELEEIRTANYAPDVLSRVFAQSDKRREGVSLLCAMDQLESSLHRLSVGMAQ